MLQKRGKILLVIFLLISFYSVINAQLTNGWTEVPYQFMIQSPYNIPMWDRYDYDPMTKTHTFTVKTSDALHFPGSASGGRRTEMKIVGYNYKSNAGNHQLEADFNVTPGTHATCIMQIKGGSGGNGGTSTNTFIMLRIYNDNLCDNQTPIMPIVKGKWYRLNVIHEAAIGKITVYVDGNLIRTKNVNIDNSDCYWKVGVYNQTGAVELNESKWRNIKILELYDSNKQMQTITFPQLPASIPLGTPDIDPGATSSSGLPIIYVTAYEPTVKFANGKMQILGEGYADVSATQPGNANYNMAPNAVQHIVVTSSTKKNQTIICDSIPVKTLGDPDFSTGATASSGAFLKVYSSNLAVATVTKDNVIHIEGPGTTTFTFLQIWNNEYNGAVLQKTFTVKLSDPPHQSIVFPALPQKSVGDEDFDPRAIATSGLPVTYTSSDTTVASIVNGKIHIKKSGTTTITASQAGNETYNAASNAIQILTVAGINKKDQTINFGALPNKYVGDTDFDPGATASSGLPVTYSSSDTLVASIISNKIRLKKAGVTTITASQTGNEEYNAAVEVSQILTVSVLADSIKWYKIKSKQYPGYVLNFTGAPAKGTNVYLDVDSGSDTQLWRLENLDSGYVKIVPMSDLEYCLDCSTTPADGINVQLWQYRNNNRQQWLISETADGFSKITIRNNNLFGLDVDTTASKNVRMWAYAEMNNQLWQLEEVKTTTSVNENVLNQEIIPSGYKLASYPNPFNPSTKINYQIPVSGYVTMKVFDILGRELAILENKMVSSGSYTINFDASRLTSGVYVALLTVQPQGGSKSIVQTMKLMLSK